MKILGIHDLSVKLGKQERIRFVTTDWEFEDAKSLLVLRGQNGSGKTTLLNVLSGHLSPTKGEATLDGAILSGHGPSAATKFGIVRGFQIPLFCTELKIWENIMLTANLCWWERADRVRNAVMKRLSDMGLKDCVDRSPIELSFGQRRIAELVRVEFQVKQPGAKLVLLDEPLAGLDNRHRVDALHLIENIIDLQIPMIVVEHDDGLDYLTDCVKQVELVRSGADCYFESLSPMAMGGRVY
jgi:ABC-type branched-subunit amino acid transport system ATPase component